MDPEFITYQKFNDSELANELTGLLDDHGVEYILQEETSGFDPSLVMSNAPVDYAVKIKSKDFERVNHLLKDDEAKNITGVNSDYYLFSFTDDELIEVITKADEWSAFDNVLARKILGERGIHISDREIEEIGKKRIEALKAPDEPQTLWIVIGYVCAFCGGVFGIFIGWYLANGKKTLPNGERVYEYSDNDRKHGRNIYYIGIVATIIFVAGKFVIAFSN
ncbi:MAG: hypothetical protein ACXVB0_19340 [Mucilaginibacter sp.]